MRRMKLLGAAAASVLALASAPAWADGTAANTRVDNVASLSYQTGGVAQTAVNSNTATFLVDRKVNLTVAEVGGAATVVNGVLTNQVTTFTVTNTSNQVLDFALATANQVNGTAAPFGGTDSFDVGNVRYYVESGATPGFDATDTLVTYLDELDVDASRTVYVVADVPAGLANGAISSVVLTATAREGGAAGGAVGAVITQTATADNPNAVDTVFADGAGATDAARDGSFSARDQYSVVSAALTLTKIATVISDPFNGTTNPKAIPGAVIEYCLVAANTGAADATNVVVTDALADKPITYVTTQSRIGGTATGTAPNYTCDRTDGAGGTQPGTEPFAGTTFTGNIGTVPAGQIRTARFQVTIN